jgi:uncharacterized membrane protein YdfJ with MMPL/SSD domain
VFAVLVDTFVVRPLLVPALMAILGRTNYWPRACPPATRGPLSNAAGGTSDTKVTPLALPAGGADADAEAGGVMEDVPL